VSYGTQKYVVKLNIVSAVLPRCTLYFTDPPSVEQQPYSEPVRLIVDVSRSHTIRQTQTHTSSRTPLNERSARRRGRYLHNTQQTQETNNIRALGGIRTRDLCSRAATDLRLRPHGYRDRCRTYYGVNKETNVQDCTFELGALARQDACRHVPNKTSFESRTDEHYLLQSAFLLHYFRL